MKKFILSVIMIFILSFSNIVYASSNIHSGKLGRHKEAVYASIRERLGITDEKIKDAKNTGKTAFDLAGEAGVSERELRSYIIQDAAKSLDKAIGKGIIPKCIVSKIKSKVEKSIENWDGHFN
jgi:ribosomal protein S20